jgi:hypothetical protein
MKERGKNKLVCIIIIITSVFIFYSCDSYTARKKLIFELSSLFNENRTEFNKICDYIYNDSLSKRFVFNYRDGKIDIDNGYSFIKIDSIYQIKDNLDIYQILTFMKKEKISIISGNPSEGWITFAFEDVKYPCFSFWHRQNFDSEDEKVKKRIKNIKDSKTKNWIYILGGGWIIQGETCF